MTLANESTAWESFHIVKIETPHHKTIATAEEVAAHRREVAGA